MGLHLSTNEPLVLRLYEKPGRMRPGFAVAYFLGFLYNLATMKKTGKQAEKASEFAVIETGGKQYLVSVGDIVEV